MCICKLHPLGEVNGGRAKAGGFTADSGFIADCGNRERILSPPPNEASEVGLSESRKRYAQASVQCAKLQNLPRSSKIAVSKVDSGFRVLELSKQSAGLGSIPAWGASHPHDYLAAAGALTGATYCTVPPFPNPSDPL